MQFIKKSYIWVPVMLVVVVVGIVFYTKQYTTIQPVSTGATFTCDYYAAPNGIPSNVGTSGSPWDLQTALDKTNVVTAGKTLCLKGGTYVGKFFSGLTGTSSSPVTVRSAPGEWAKIDGFKTVTLATAIDSSTRNVSLVDGTGVMNGHTIHFDSPLEEIQLDGKDGSGNTFTSANRGWSGSSPAAHPVNSVGYVVGNQLEIRGSYTTYRDFEVMNSFSRRTDSSVYQEIIRGSGIVITGDNLGNKVINTVIHDNVNGIFTGQDANDKEFYGNVIYNNGFEKGSLDAAGHGMYVENAAGYITVKDNIILNSFNLGTQAFGVTAKFEGGVFEGNTYANTGSPTARGASWRERNLLVGTESQPITYVEVKNNNFYHPRNANGGNLSMGYGSIQNLGALITGNYIGGGGSAMFVEKWRDVTATNNTFHSSNFLAQLERTSGGTFSWNNNTYYNETASVNCAGGNRPAPFGIPGSEGQCGGLLDFNEWKSFSGLDAASTYSASGVPPNRVVVRPNEYEEGRAHVTVYNWSLSNSVNVNLGLTGLVDGQEYEIRNAFNYFGTPVATGTYNSGSATVSISMTSAAATSVATPGGYNFTPATTLPEFGVFVVVPTSEESNPTPAPTISSFTATPATIASGNSSTLAWSVSGATSLSINQGIGTVTGTSRSVSPTVTTTYTLTATNSAGSTTATATVTVNPAGDTTAPTVSITSPSNNATVSGSINMTASASDNVGVVGVQFKVDGTNSGLEDISSPYSVSLNTISLSNGSHSITAVARDAAGNTTTSSAITVTVSNATPDTTAPTASITAPSNNATVSGTTTISANASDNVGVVGVQFKVDGSNVGSEDMNSPYAISWDSTAVSNGSHTITAVARDAATNSTTSSAITVTVNNVIAPTQVATASISPNGGSFTGNQAVTLATTTSGATIYYTTDGSTPTTSSTQYTGAVTISATTTVKAIAVKSGMTDSSVASATFTRSSSSGGGGGGGGGGGSSKPKPGKLTDRDNFICTGNPTVYFYLQGQKEAYSELAAYQAWNGNDFSNIKMITQAECNAIPLKGLVRLPQGMFVKVAGNPTVYRIEGTTARPYTTYSALLRDSQGKIIYTITIPLLHTYSLGAIIN